MKWYLVNKFDEIVDTCEIASGVGISGAKTYFKGMKRMPEDKDFDKLWSVMSSSDYDRKLRASLQNRQVEWWKEDEYLDIDK